MRHGNSRDSANRHGNGLSRSTLEQTDDTKLLQEVAVRLFHNEQQGTPSTIEHFHPYGFTARPKKPTMLGAVRQTAEAIFAFLGGNRSHGVALVVGDRRYRPNNLQEGESVLHDDQQQQVYLSRNLIVINVPAGKNVHIQTGDGAHLLLSPSKAKLQWNDLSVTISSQEKIFLGSETGPTYPVAVYGPSGLTPSQKVFAVIGATDTAMPMDAIAKRTQAQS